MESIVIKRSTQPFRSLVWLFVTLIPVILFSYAMFKARGNYDRFTFGIITIVFLLPSIVDFIANRLIQLKAAITISEQELVLSSSKGLYDSFAFLQTFQSQRKKLIQWQDVSEFKLSVHYKYLISYPNEGEVTSSATYSMAEQQLCIVSKIKNEDVIFSLHNLDRTPEEILILCNTFLKKFTASV